MKNRIISMLLTVLLVMSLFTGMSVSAYADDDTAGSYTQSYTLAEGDTVLKVCQKLGLNFYTCKNIIMKLNNIQNDTKFRFLSVGQTILLPVSDAAAIQLTLANSGSGSTTKTPTSTVTYNGYTVAYYMIPYTMQRGETVAGVCSSLGIDFSSYADQILKLNNLSSWKKVNAGSTIYLPTNTAPAAGTTCMLVLAHKVAAGETAYTICSKYGVNYGSQTKLLQALNNTSNLSSIKSGANFYVPVTTTITVPASTVTTSGTASTTTGTAASTGSTTTSSTEATTTSSSAKNAAYYSITANLNSVLGSAYFVVDGKTATSAVAGDTVSVVVNANSGVAVSGIAVKYADGSADVLMNGNSFTMPACNVRVDVNFSTGYDIEVKSNYPAKTVIRVDGVETTAAAAGTVVKVTSSDASFGIKNKLKIYRAQDNKNITSEVNFISDDSFVMPGCAIIVEVKLKSVKTYDIYCEDSANGSYTVLVNGSAAGKAAEDAEITIKTTPNKGYYVSKIEYKEHNKNVTPTNVALGSFKMPNYAVDIVVTFDATDNKINLNQSTGGSLKAYSDEAKTDEISRQTTGKKVYVEATKNTNFKDCEEIVVARMSDGTKLPISYDKTKKLFSFNMAAGGVDVTGIFEGADYGFMVANNLPGGKLIVTVNGEEASPASSTSTHDTYNVCYGDIIGVEVEANDGSSFKSFSVKNNTTQNVELENLLNFNGRFTMPATGDIVISAEFETANIVLPEIKIVEGRGTASFKVFRNGMYYTQGVCKTGDTVMVIPEAAASFNVKSVKVTNVDTGMALSLTDKYEFTMPACNVKVEVAFEGVSKAVTVSMKTLVDQGDNTTKDITGNSSWYITRQNSFGEYSEEIYDNTNPLTYSKANVGDIIHVYLSDAAKQKYDIVGLKLNGYAFGGSNFYFAVPDTTLPQEELGNIAGHDANGDLNLEIILKAKAGSGNVIAIDKIWYDDTMGTAEALVGGQQAASCKVNDTVVISAVAKDGYEVTSVVVQRKDTTAYILAITGNPVDMSKAYFEMPEGGVNIGVTFSAKTQTGNTIKVMLTKENGSTEDIAAKGVVQLNAGSNNIQIQSGTFNSITTDTDVNVSLNNLGRQKYEITSVVIPGVAVTGSGNSYSFKMPDKSVDITVNVRYINGNQNYVNLNYSAENSSYGKIVFYEDSACTKVITGIDTEGTTKTVYAKAVFDKAGYQLVKDSFNAVNSKDKTTAFAGPDLNGVYTLTVTKEGVTVGCKFEKVTSKLTIKLQDNFGSPLTGLEYVKISANGLVETPVKDGDTVSLQFDTYVSIGRTAKAETDGYYISKVEGGVNCSNGGFNVPAADATIIITLSK